MKEKIILAVTNDLVTDQRVNKIATSLSQQGCDVTLVGRLLPNSIALPNKPYRQTRMRLIFQSSFLFYAEYNFRLFIKLLFSRFDIITANDLDTLLACYLAAKIRRKKIIYDSHEYFTEVPELLNNPTAKRFWTCLEQWIFPHLTKVSTVCQSIADIYRSKYNVDVKVIRNLPFCKPQSEQITKDTQFQGKRMIIYQGAVNIGRGIELMIEAVRHLENVIFLIIGGGDKELSLRQYVEQQHLTDKVKFTGKLHYEQLHHYTQQADLGMSLEQNMGLNYYYALPNKIFDYIQGSTPIIASDLPEIKRIVEEYGIGEIAQSTQPEDLAQQINNLLTDHDKIANIKANQKIAAQQLCWENEVEKLYNLYFSD